MWNVTDYRVPVEFEGGNFMNDTKANCFMSQGLFWANPIAQTAVVQYMKDYLGCQNSFVVQPLANEGTTHIDMQSKIVNDTTVIVGEYSPSQDPQNHTITNNNAAYIEAAGYNIVRMPMPTNADGSFRTFINSLFVNGVNMLPVYSIDLDKKAEAMAIWQQVMPGWQHVPMNSDDVITWAGAIHCITMTVAKGTLSPLEPTPAYACGGDWDCYPDSGPVQSCGDMGYVGCCDGQTLTWCENNALKTMNCSGNPNCGWDVAKGFYNCGTAGQADPSGDHPLKCGGCVPDCAGKNCGSNGCGGSCGTCPAGSGCAGGQCVATSDDCDGVSFEGCCDSETLHWCEGGALKSSDCAGKPHCGWDEAQGYYNCATEGQADPSGDNPLSCGGGSCEPDCVGRDCGNDGCEGSCGTCATGMACNDSGTCEPDGNNADCPWGTVWNGSACVQPDQPADDPDGSGEQATDDSSSACTTARRPSTGALALFFALLLSVHLALRRRQE